MWNISLLYILSYTSKYLVELIRKCFSSFEAEITNEISSFKWRKIFILMNIDIFQSDWLDY